jgi:hypothetical protein
LHLLIASFICLTISCCNYDYNCYNNNNYCYYCYYSAGWLFSGIAVPLSHPSVISREMSDFFDMYDDEVPNNSKNKNKFSMTAFHNERKTIAADMQAAPVEGVNVSVESWGIALEYARGIFMKEFLPILDFKCAVNPKTWKVTSPRCPLCRLGIVRCRAPSDTHSAESSALSTLLTNYCTSCAVRCVLYNKVRRCIPRAQKARLAKDWPVYLPPEYYPLSRGERKPIHHTLSHDNLDLLDQGLLPTGEESAPPSPKTSKYDVFAGGRGTFSSGQFASGPLNASGPLRGAGGSARAGTLSPDGRAGSAMSSAMRARSIVPPRVKSPTSRVIEKMLKRDDDSDEEQQDEASVSSSPKRASRFLSKGSPDRRSKAKTAALQKSQSMAAMPSFMRKFSASVLCADNVLKEPEPEPIPDMNLETRYGPQELALAPFLIAKGQYDEVERLLRVAMCLEDVLGEAGAVHTVSILLLQADMYMLLDFFPLALGLYLDSIDILGSSLGLDDERFVDAVQKLLSCAKRMGVSDDFSDRYVTQLCHTLEGSMIPAKQAMVDSVDRVQTRSEKQEALLAEVFLLVKDCDHLLHSNSDYRQMVSSVKGLISFVNMIESPNGLASAARLMFVQYCCNTAFPPPSAPGRGEAKPKSKTKTVPSPGKPAQRTYGPIAQFVLACCRIRSCQDDEVHRFLLQNLVQKYLSKHENVIGNLVPDCDTIIKNIRMHVTEKLEKKGRAVGVDEFDPLLKSCILFLYSENLYARFLRSSPDIRRLVVYELMDSEAEYAHICVITIQSFWRQKYMKWQVARRRSNRVILDTLNASGSLVMPSK